ncbi:MAG: N-acetylmuramoyl-L-alanine amidase [Bacteriovoracaceae bacterium]
MNRFIQIISCIILIGFVQNNILANSILIDPGHGGDDFGATTIINKKHIYEKDLALSISLKLFEKLKKKKYDVYLTRSIDRNIGLDERALLANKLNTDLYISIHINSNKDIHSQGIETYYLDNHNDSAVEKVEKVENINWIGKEPKEQVVNQILTDLVIQQTVTSSKKLATFIHSKLKVVGERFDMPNRGIKAGLFYVLALAKRPSILVEAGFISSEKEVKKLMNEQFQEDYAAALFEGIESYFKDKSKTRN